MNKIFLMGRLTKDINESEDVRYTSGDNPTCITNFSLAVDKKFKNKNNPDAPTADFFRIVAFGKTAEFAKNYLVKGVKVVIEGRIENNNYTDANGNKVYKDQIIAEAIEFAESKKVSESNGANVGGGDNSFVNAGIDTKALNDDLPF